MTKLRIALATAAVLAIAGCFVPIRGQGESREHEGDGRSERGREHERERGKDGDKGKDRERGDDGGDRDHH